MTSVTLRAGPLRRVRCVSYTDVPADELFAAPGAAGRTFASFLEASGRVEAIWYPFTDAPWLKVWTRQPAPARGARVVRAPYNYPFSDTLPDAEQRAIRQGVLANPSGAVALGQASYAETVAQLGAENSGDIWGAAKDVLLYVRPSTLRVTANGYAILTGARRPARDQRLRRPLPAVVARYRARACTAEHARRDPRHRTRPSPRRRVDRAQPALLSALAPRADHPHSDVTVWLDILTLPGAPAANHAYRDIERSILATTGPRTPPSVPSRRRAGPTPRAAPRRIRFLERTLPHASGRAAAGTSDAAVRTLERLDPRAVFSSPLCARCCAPQSLKPAGVGPPLGLLPVEQAIRDADASAAARLASFSHRRRYSLYGCHMEAERRRCTTTAGRPRTRGGSAGPIHRSSLERGNPSCRVDPLPARRRRSARLIVDELVVRARGLTNEEEMR